MNIIFHFGPPKTGTSAIQKWLSSNTSWLEKQHVYYPQHNLDPNGVSSGNLRNVFSGDKGNFQFSKALFDKEVERAKEKNCQSLLFSSEFFFRNIDVIAEQVPEALFVGYIRFGLETLQSSYNQAVKRHGRTSVFAPGNHIQSTLTALSRKIDLVGDERFILKPYSSALFANNNLVADFLQTLNILTPDIDTKVGRVNSSYSSEAIEVKRWFNQLESDSLQTRLDLALQGYGNQQPFSLLSDEVFEKLKQRYLLQLDRFLSKHHVEDGKAFYHECERLANHPYMQQTLSTKEFDRVISDLIKDKKLTYASMYMAYSQAKLKKSELENPERVEVLKKVIPTWVKLMAGLKAKLTRKKP